MAKDDKGNGNVNFEKPPEDKAIEDMQTSDDKIVLGVDVSSLSPEDIAAIRVQARKQVREEKRKAAGAALLNAMVKDQKREVGLEEPLDQVVIDLAPYAAYVMIDGQKIFQGQVVEVPESQARSLREIVARTWDHQSEIEGKRRQFYRSRGLSIGMSDDGRPIVKQQPQGLMV